MFQHQPPPPQGRSRHSLHRHTFRFANPLPVDRVPFLLSLFRSVFRRTSMAARSVLEFLADSALAAPSSALTPRPHRTSPLVLGRYPPVHSPASAARASRAGRHHRGRSGLARAGHCGPMAWPRAWAPLPSWPDAVVGQRLVPLCRPSSTPSASRSFHGQNHVRMKMNEAR